MSIKHLFEEIEGIEFATNVDILSGFKIFLNALSEDLVLLKLTEELEKHPQSRQETLHRIRFLINKNDQPEYMHPYDAALAGYLYTLSRVDVPLAHKAIESILQTSQLWWSRRLAKYLQERLPRGETQVVQIVGVGKGYPVVNTVSLNRDVIHIVPLMTRQPKAYIAADKVASDTLTILTNRNRRDIRLSGRSDSSDVYEKVV